MQIYTLTSECNCASVARRVGLQERPAGLGRRRRQVAEVWRHPCAAKKSAPACLRCPCCWVLVALPPPINCAGQPSFAGDPLRGMTPSLFRYVAGVGRAVGLEPAGYPPLALLRQDRTKAKASAAGVGPHTPPPSLPRWTASRRSSTPPQWLPSAATKFVDSHLPRGRAPPTV
jgi:hypothetical protein